jgi:phosphoserine phosphatase RsbU/P
MALEVSGRAGSSESLARSSKLFPSGKATGDQEVVRILIAEDDAVSRRYLEMTLRKWGYEVVVTADGEEAWHVLKSPPAPGVAILDWIMPKMDGLEVCQKVREGAGTVRTYIILLTSREGVSDTVRGLESGADDYLTKPFDADELRARVGVAVRVAQLQRSLEDRVRQLEDALARVKQLQGLLPICSYCKKIRDDQNYWQQVEGYISEHSEAQFSHGICPDCFAKYVKPDLEKSSPQKSPEP